MNDEMTWFLMAISVFIVIVCIFGWREDREAKEQYEKGYIDACKDNYKGKLKYHLVENGDGTKEWKKVK